MCQRGWSHFVRYNDYGCICAFPDLYTPQIVSDDPILDSCFALAQHWAAPCSSLLCSALCATRGFTGPGRRDALHRATPHLCSTSTLAVCMPQRQRSPIILPPPRSLVRLGRRKAIFRKGRERSLERACRLRACRLARAGALHVHLRVRARSEAARAEAAEARMHRLLVHLAHELLEGACGEEGKRRQRREEGRGGERRGGQREVTEGGEGRRREGG